MCGSGTDVLVFAAAEQQIALLARDVERVLPAAQLTALPGAPAPVVGLLDVAGVVLPVFDLRRRLGLPARAVQPSDCLVLADAGGRRVALQADAALAFATIPTADLGRDSLVDDIAAYVTATGVWDGELLVVLDLTRFLSQEETADLEFAVAQRGQLHHG